MKYSIEKANFLFDSRQLPITHMEDSIQFRHGHRDFPQRHAFSSVNSILTFVGGAVSIV